jgi:NAD(P)-dependent dehydrogenase (short-subunit alcohol dehydrogenase family)
MKAAIVTGASRGIGAATARLLANLGYAVVINYLNNSELALTLAHDICESGGCAMAWQTDLRKPEDVLYMFDAVNKEFHNITALVNNAGISHGSTEEIFATNVFGMMTACREVVHYMKQYGGAIVNISSEAARFGGNNMSEYAASKAAVNTFTIGFAREAAAYGVRVNAVSPGIIDTDTHANITPDRLISLPMKRMGKSQEVAEAVAWLISDKASYVSGAILSVSGAR